MRYLFDLENTESARRRVWERMQAEGITRTILWNRVQPSYADWLQTVPPETTLLGLAYDPNRSEPGAFSGAGRAGESSPVPAALAGAFWIAPFGRCGTCHFVIFRDWRREAVPLGQAALRCIFAHWDFVSLLAGYPAPYHHVQHFIRALGFLPLGRLPEACAMPTPARPRRCRDMALALLSRTPEQTLSV